MHKKHHYHLSLTWTGNKGAGTSAYTTYERSYSINALHKAEISGTADPAFRGDPTKYNPEELLVASIASCHMLWYLHLCAQEGIVVMEYCDNTTGIMDEKANGSGTFTKVILHPIVSVAEESMKEKANTLHEKANRMCFIANSVNFPIDHNPTCVVTPMHKTSLTPKFQSIKRG